MLTGRTGRRHNTYQPSVGLTLDPVITLTRWEKKAAQHAQPDLLIHSCFVSNSKNNMRKTNYDSVNHAPKKAEETQVQQKTIRFWNPDYSSGSSESSVASYCSWKRSICQGWLEFRCKVLAGVFAFLFLCVNVFNYMLAGLKISLNLRVSFGCLKDSLVSVSAAVMDIINPTPSNPVMLNSFSKTCK